MSVHLRTVRVKMQSQKNRGKIAIGVQNRGKNAIAPNKNVPVRREIVLEHRKIFYGKLF